MLVKLPGVLNPEFHMPAIAADIGQKLPARSGAACIGPKLPTGKQVSHLQQHIRETHDQEGAPDYQKRGQVGDGRAGCPRIAYLGESRLFH